MTDVSTLPPLVEVRWDGTGWVDETARLVDVDVEHGSQARSNPDRPTVMSGRGSLTLIGSRTVEANAGERRVAVRISHDGVQRWTGWLQEPRPVQGVEQATRWRLVGLLDDQLARHADIDAAPRTVQAWLGEGALWQRLLSRPVTWTDLPARSLRGLSWSGRLGEFLSRFGAAASAELCERSDGELRMAGVVLAAAPSATVPVIDGSQMWIDDVTSRDRADRIRTSARTSQQRASVGEVDDVEIALTVASWSASRVVLTGTVRTAPGETLSAGDVSVGSVEALYPARLNSSASAPLSVAATGGWTDVSPTVTVTTATSGRDTTITVTVTSIAGTGRCHSRRHVRSSSLGHGVTVVQDVGVTISGMSARRISALAVAQQDMRTVLGITDFIERTARFENATKDPFMSPAFDLRGSASVALRRTVEQTPEILTAANGPGIAAWGDRPLDLPHWFATAPDLAAVIAPLSELRREHIITAPADQAANLLDHDTGDLIDLRIDDHLRNTRVNRRCLVTGRRLRWNARTGLTAALRCLEVSGAGQIADTAPPAPTVTSLTVARSDRAGIWHGDTTWTMPDTGSFADSFDIRWHVGVSSGWLPTGDIDGLRIDNPATRHWPLTDIPGETGNAPLTVEVRARNEHGISDWAARTIALPGSALTAPSGLFARWQAGERLLVWWDPPASGLADDYLAAWTGHRAGSMTTTDTRLAGPRSAQNSIGTTVTVTVTARNAAGDSPPATLDITITAADPPRIVLGTSRYPLTLGASPLRLSDT